MKVTKTVSVDGSQVTVTVEDESVSVSNANGVRLLMTWLSVATGEKDVDPLEQGEIHYCSSCRRQSDRAGYCSPECQKAHTEYLKQFRPLPPEPDMR